MHIFGMKDSHLKLHRYEKSTLMMGSILNSIILLVLGIVMWQIEDHRLISYIASSALILISIGYPVLVYRTLSGKGIYKP